MQPSSLKEPRKPVVQGLEKLLASTYSLYLKTQNFHWNVIGPTFFELHLLFEKQYQELAEALDLIAERIRALGYSAPGSFSEFLKLTQIKDSLDKKNAEGMIKELTADHQRMISLIQELVVVASDCQDEGSFDLLVERLKAHEKIAWMLESLSS